MSFDQPNNDDRPPNAGAQQSPYGDFNPYGQSQDQQQSSANAGGQSWPQGQPSWGQSQPPLGVQGGHPSADFSAPPPGQAPAVSRDSNPLKAMFDFSFTTFATPGLVKLVYGLSIVIGILYWLGLIVTGFMAGSSPVAMSPYSTESSTTFSPVPGILAILLGWIPAFLWILLIRIGLEFAIATVRTSEDIRHIRANT